MAYDCIKVVDPNNRAQTDRWCASDCLLRFLIAATGVAMLLWSSGYPVQASPLQQGTSAFMREDYVRASRILIPLAERGNPAAQAYLGFMFETGRGVPQNYTEAAMWYRRSAEQGYGAAQYALGLLYDKGFGVPQDVVEANKWLTLSAANANPQDRVRRALIRDAVTTKMTHGQLARARTRALEWAPIRER
jgi:TPR repeat protein